MRKVVVSLCVVMLYTLQVQAQFQAQYTKFLLLAFKPTSKTKVFNFMNDYKSAANKFKNIDHTNFSQALQDGHKIGATLNFFNSEFKKQDIVFDPFKDCPNSIIDGLNDDQIAKMSDRIDDIHEQIKSDK